MSATITGTQVGQGVYLDMAKIRRVLDAAIAPALKEIVKAEEEATMAHLSVPVERDFGGNVIKRSDPGDAPRMEDDILRQNVEGSVVKEESGSVGYLVSSRPAEEAGDDPDAALILEFGGVSNWGYVQPRPYMRPAAERMAEYAAEVIATHLKNALR